MHDLDEVAGYILTWAIIVLVAAGIGTMLYFLAWLMLL